MMIIWQSFVVSHSLLVGHLGCLIFFFFLFLKKSHYGASLAAQWLRSHASSAGAQVQSLFRALRPCMPCGEAKNKKIRSSHGYDKE